MQASSIADRIVVYSLGKALFLKTDEILYLRADGAYCEIFMKTGDMYSISKTLGSIGRMLSDHKNFMRVHRSYIININYVLHVEGTNKSSSDLTLEGNIIIPITDALRKQLVDRFRGNRADIDDEAHDNEQEPTQGLG